jgi:Arc-like DNA binding domain
MTRKPNDTVQVNLRVPEWLRLDVLRRSEKSGRSFNGELIHLIEEGMAKPQTAALIDESVDKAVSRMAEVWMADTSMWQMLDAFNAERRGKPPPDSEDPEDLAARLTKKIASSNLEPHRRDEIIRGLIDALLTGTSVAGSRK